MSKPSYDTPDPFPFTRGLVFDFSMRRASVLHTPDRSDSVQVWTGRHAADARLFAAAARIVELERERFRAEAELRRWMPADGIQSRKTTNGRLASFNRELREIITGLFEGAEASP